MKQGAAAKWGLWLGGVALVAAAAGALVWKTLPGVAGVVIDRVAPQTVEVRTGWMRDSVQMVYPYVAREQKLEGSVVLALTIEADGRISAASVDTGSGHAVLDAAALDAAHRFQVDPDRLGADAFPYEKLLKITFRDEAP